MIGVCVPDRQRQAVEEFFQLFKTPWEFAQSGKSYDVVISTYGDISKFEATLAVISTPEHVPFDAKHQLSLSEVVSGSFYIHAGTCCPVYSRCLAVSTTRSAVPILTTRDTHQLVCVQIALKSVSVVRLGFDLFEEATYLLSVGQPSSHALCPSLDILIQVLRERILAAGIELVEIPPIPWGFSFAACLTHDVDHPVIRNHLLDQTMLGFLARATIGSASALKKGLIDRSGIFENLRSVAALPFVYANCARDLWTDSLLNYLQIEKGLASTFFFIPFPGLAGRPLNDNCSKRAAKYDLTKLKRELFAIDEAGGEVGLHGIDAWNDEASALREKDAVTQVLPEHGRGVRMHWLFFDHSSPFILEEAGFDYDSTWGFNEAVGFRAGTSQVFRFLGLKSLLELPLNIMDTSLFYPSRLGLNFNQAKALVEKLVDLSVSNGGVLTINWHDRSLAPERLWGGFYQMLLDLLKSRSAWFATASQAVSWFKRRRLTEIRWNECGSTTCYVTAPHVSAQVPDMRLRIHRPNRGSSTSRYVDLRISEDVSAFAV